MLFLASSEGPARRFVLELLVARRVDLADLTLFAVDQKVTLTIWAQRVVSDARRDLPCCGDPSWTDT